MKDKIFSDDIEIGESEILALYKIGIGNPTLLGVYKLALKLYNENTQK